MFHWKAPTVLIAQQLRVKGRHYDLVPPTSLQASSGSLLLVAGELQPQRTALALTLSARMKPSDGKISWDRSSNLGHLRRRSALIDSPGVNEPEQHLSVKDLVTEDLALLPRRYRGIRRGADWIKVNAFEDIADVWVDEVPAARRLGLLCALALANPEVDLLLVDSPDRHCSDPADWLPQLEALAQDPGRPLCIVATVTAVPEQWTGAVVRLANPTLPAAEPATGPDAAAEPETRALEVEESQDNS